MDYQSPNEILDAVVLIFPGFKAEWEDENPYIEEDGGFNLSAVYMELLPYVSGKVAEFSREQIQSLANLLNEAVSAGGNSRNAVAACFLEHVGQVGLYKILKPLLSKEAKNWWHA